MRRETPDLPPESVENFFDARYGAIRSSQADYRAESDEEPVACWCVISPLVSHTPEDVEEQARP